MDTLSILLIEDNEADEFLTARLLKKNLPSNVNIDITWVATLQDAVAKLINAIPYDVILTDLGLPDSQGLDTLQKLLQVTQATPIIVMTGLDNESISLKAIDLGAQDYWVKGQLDTKHLLRTIHYAIKRHHLINNLKTYEEKQIEHLKTHDVLTNLPNEFLLLDKMNKTIDAAKEKHFVFSLLLIKVHELTKVEHLLGEESKNKLILESAHRIQNISFKESLFVAKYSNDTFAILCNKVNDSSIVMELATRIQQKLVQLMSLGNRQYYPVINIGVSIYPFDGSSSQELIIASAAALETACNQGPNTSTFFSDKFKNDDNGQLLFLGDIQNALDNSEFILYFQPQISMKDNTICGMEGLLRWNNPSTGMIAPDTFIPLAEESGLILPIGAWVIDTGCRYLKIWLDKYRLPLTFTVSLNVSVKQLQHTNILQVVNRALKKYSIPPSCIEIELTERIFADDIENITSILHTFKNEGISISIDDFGTGYSSLSYLSHLPVNKLKIDRSFVEKSLHNPTAATVVKSIIGLAHDIDLVVIAEGVETKEQWDFLAQHGCDIVQGFYCYKPKHPDEIHSLLANTIK